MYGPLPQIPTNAGRIYLSRLARVQQCLIGDADLNLPLPTNRLLNLVDANIATAVESGSSHVALMMKIY
jgi:hypothetical protein